LRRVTADGLVVRASESADRPEIRSVLTSAFGRPVVADLADALAERADSVSLVAVEGSRVVGYVGLSRSWVDAPDRPVDVLVLSPLGVVPGRQRRGIGRALMARAVASAVRAGDPLLFLEGDPAYYAQFGFVPASPSGFTPPSVRIPDPGFQVLPLLAYDPTVKGALVYNETFWAYDCVGLR
jgi:putative acetyltransferase